MLGNNVSANINNVLGKKSVSIGNPYMLGKSLLDSGAYYANNLPYFIGYQLSNGLGNFPSPYIITISGKDITQFVMAFDIENGAFPNSIIVDDETIYDDDSIWEINVNKADTHTIIISNWNKIDSPFIITSIYTDIVIDIGQNNLIAFNSNIMDRTNTQYPSYGIISNHANLTFSDLHYETIDLISQQILHSGITVDVFLNNTFSNMTEQVYSMEIRELSYDNDNRQVQLSLKDNLEEWQDINVPSVNYMDIQEKLTAKWLYLNLRQETPSKYHMQLFEELDSETQNILENTVIQYPTLEEDTLWNDWQKLCALCMLHIYVDNNGKTICRYNNGN